MPTFIVDIDFSGELAQRNYAVGIDHRLDNVDLVAFSARPMRARQSLFFERRVFNGRRNGRPAPQTASMSFTDRFGHNTRKGSCSESLTLDGYLAFFRTQAGRSAPWQGPINFVSRAN